MYVYIYQYSSTHRHVQQFDQITSNNEEIFIVIIIMVTQLL